MKPIRWRLIFVMTLSLLALYIVGPTLIYFTQPKETRNDPDILATKIPSWLPEKHINLGLDLQGGVHFVLGVETQGAVENRLNRIAVEVSRWAKDNSVELDSIFVKPTTQILTVSLKKEEDLDTFKLELKKEFPLLEILKRDNLTIQYTYKQYVVLAGCCRPTKKKIMIDRKV